MWLWQGFFFVVVIDEVVKMAVTVAGIVVVVPTVTVVVDVVAVTVAVVLITGYYHNEDLPTYHAFHNDYSSPQRRSITHRIRRTPTDQSDHADTSPWQRRRLTSLKCKIKQLKRNRKTYQSNNDIIFILHIFIYNNTNKSKKPNALTLLLIRENVPFSSLWMTNEKETGYLKEYGPAVF